MNNETNPEVNLGIPKLFQWLLAEMSYCVIKSTDNSAMWPADGAQRKHFNRRQNPLLPRGIYRPEVHQASR